MGCPQCTLFETIENATDISPHPCVKGTQDNVKHALKTPPTEKEEAEALSDGAENMLTIPDPCILLSSFSWLKMKTREKG